MARMNRKQGLQREASRVGLYVATYSPGDGITRYRFFRSRKPVSYFTADGIFTALGISEAESYLRGYSRGRGRR